MQSLGYTEKLLVDCFLLPLLTCMGQILLPPALGYHESDDNRGNLQFNVDFKL